MRDVMMRLLVGLALVMAASVPVRPQPAAPARGPWFGVPLPQPMSAAPAVRVGARAPRPVLVPPGDPVDPAFAGAAIKADVATIVNFATQARARKEMGGDQMWGRVAGFPSATETVNWAAAEFRRAGIADVEVQPIAQDARRVLLDAASWGCAGG